MDRQLIAYLLMAALVAFAAGVIGYKIYHGRERTIRRERARKRAAYEKQKAEQP